MPNPINSADASYRAHQQIIADKIAELERELAEHAKTQAQKAWNWGFVGDLQNINTKLDGILQYLKS